MIKRRWLPSAPSSLSLSAELCFNINFNCTQNKSRSCRCVPIKTVLPIVGGKQTKKTNSNLSWQGVRQADVISAWVWALCYGWWIRRGGGGDDVLVLKRWMAGRMGEWQEKRWSRGGNFDALVLLIWDNCKVVNLSCTHIIRRVFTKNALHSHKVLSTRQRRQLCITCLCSRVWNQ